MNVCLFCWRYNPLSLYFHSPVAGFSLLVFARFLDHTRHTTVGRTPLDEVSTRRRDLHLTTHNTHNRQTSTSPVGFEPTISAGERPNTYVLDSAATGTGTLHEYLIIFTIISPSVLLRMRNVSDKSCRENQNTHFVFGNFFPKIVPFMR
jgi:hypothetical protein